MLQMLAVCDICEMGDRASEPTVLSMPTHDADTWAVMNQTMNPFASDLLIGVVSDGDLSVWRTVWAVTESHMPRCDRTSSPPHSGGSPGRQKSERANCSAGLLTHVRMGWVQQFEHAACSSTSAGCVMDLV